MVQEHQRDSVVSASFRGRELTIDGRVVSMSHEIENVIPLSDRAIVLLVSEDYADDDPAVERNVFAVGKSGGILWQIKRTREHTANEGFSPFTAVVLTDDGFLRVFEWDGVRHDLDPATGELSNPLFTR